MIPGTGWEAEMKKILGFRTAVRNQILSRMGATRGRLGRGVRLFGPGQFAERCFYCR